MLRPRFRRSPLLLVLALAGCSSTIGSKFGGNPESRSVVVNGDHPLPATVGEPGGQVAAETAEPEPKRNPKARISGRVLDESGKPVPDATVRLADGNSKGGRDVRARTDRSGAFTLGGLRPGSSYWLIAEVEDDQGSRTGRVRARTAETGVEISLGDQGEDGTDPADNRSAAPARARKISDREEVDRPAPKVNDEDLAPPADEAEPAETSAKATRPAGRPRLAAPEPAAGWKKPGDPSETRRQARNEPDPDAEAEPSRPEPRSRPAADGGEDDGPNPLPPAIDPARAAQGDEPATATRTKRKPKAAPADAESGGLTLPPEANADDSPEPETPRPRANRKPKAQPGPPPMPSLDSTQLPAEVPALADATATAPASRLEPDPALIASSPPAGLAPDPVPESAASPSTGGEAVALHDPPGPAGLPAFPNPIPTTNPAPEPVSASPAPAVVAVVAPTPATPPGEYNPFALAAEPAPAAPAAPPVVKVTPAVVAMASTEDSRPTPSALEPDPSQDAPKPAPAPKTKWGDVAPSPAPARLASDAVRPMSLLARFRPAGPGRDRATAAAPLCEYDAKARKLADFRLPDLEGKPVRFRDLDSDYVLLDFWGTWCNPCLDSIPHLVELQKKYGPGQAQGGRDRLREGGRRPTPG